MVLAITNLILVVVLLCYILANKSTLNQLKGVVNKMSVDADRLAKAAAEIEKDTEQITNIVVGLRQVKSDLETEVTRLTEIVNNQGGDTSNLNEISERLEAADAKLDELTGVANSTEETTEEEPVGETTES